ncbi:fibroblast growth factor-binding protein 3 [Aplochiton taeniatus]
MRVLRWTLCLLLLLCLSGLPGWSEAKRQSAEAPAEATPSQAPRRPRNRSGPGSGELGTKDGHRCTWETSGEGVVTLLVTCHPGGEVTPAGPPGAEPETYWCRYAGKPDLCPAYGGKSSQYWKQLVGKLKKRRNACEGERVIKTKMCKKAPSEAHMKLSQRSGEEGGMTAEEKRGRGGGRKKELTTEMAPEDVKAETERKKKDEEEEKRKKEEAEEEEERTGFAGGRDGEVNDMVPMETYCAEGWHSVCSFFVRFFEG